MTPAEQKIDSLWRGTLQLKEENKLVNYVKIARYLLNEVKQQYVNLSDNVNLIDALLELDDAGKELTLITREIISRLPKENIPGEFIDEINEKSKKIENLIAEKKRLESEYKQLLESKVHLEEEEQSLSQLIDSIKELEHLQAKCSESLINENLTKAIEQQVMANTLLTTLYAEIEKQTQVQLNILNRRYLEDASIHESIEYIRNLLKNPKSDSLNSINSFIISAHQSLNKGEKLLQELLDK